MPDDATLLRQYVETRSEAAFSELVARHLSLVYHCALRQLDGDSHLAQDVAQTVFVLLAEKSAALRSHPSVAGWLYATTHFKVSEARRAERRRKHREAIMSASRETVAPPPSEHEPLGPLMDQAILELNWQDREAVLLRFFEGQAYAEIAARLLLTEKTAHKRVERALDKLRERLARRGITSTAAALTASLITQAGMAAPAGLAARVAGAAVAPAHSVTAFTALKLMSTAKTASGIAALAGVLALGLAWRETALVQRTAAMIAAANQEREILQGRIQQLKVREVAPSSSGRAAGEGAAPGAAVRTAASTADFNRDPRVHAAVGKLVAWNNATYFGPLLQSAGLSDAQVARAEYLLGQSTNFLGFGPAPISFKTDPRSDAEIRAELRQVIGAAGAASLSTYAIVRDVTEQLAGSLSASEEPLTAQQAGALTQILVSENQGTPQADTWLHSQSTDWPAAYARAQSVLSPNQLAMFKDIANGDFRANVK